MAKTFISASTRNETRAGLDNGRSFAALCKPLKMTATLKRRALKKKIKQPVAVSGAVER